MCMEVFTTAVSLGSAILQIVPAINHIDVRARQRPSQCASRTTKNTAQF